MPKDPVLAALERVTRALEAHTREVERIGLHLAKAEGELGVVRARLEVLLLRVAGFERAGAVLILSGSLEEQLAPSAPGGQLVRVCTCCGRAQEPGETFEFSTAWSDTVLNPRLIKPPQLGVATSSHGDRCHRCVDTATTRHVPCYLPEGASRR